MLYKEAGNIFRGNREKKRLLVKSSRENPSLLLSTMVQILQRSRLTLLHRSMQAVRCQDARMRLGKNLLAIRILWSIKLSHCVRKDVTDVCVATDRESIYCEWVRARSWDAHSWNQRQRDRRALVNPLYKHAQKNAFKCFLLDGRLHWKNCGGHVADGRYVLQTRAAASCWLWSADRIPMCCFKVPNLVLLAAEARLGTLTLITL